MSDNDANVERLLDLTEAVCDQVASPSDLEELDVLLLADRRSRQDYLDYYRMHVALRLQLRARRAAEKVQQQIDSHSIAPMPIDLTVETIETPAAVPLSFLGNTMGGAVGYFTSGWPVAYLVATVILGMGFLVGAFVHVSQPTQVARDESVSLPSSLSPFPSMVGRITGMVDCQWADPATEAFNGAYVPLDRKYALASGLMEITYNSGAKVVLQGPCTYEVESPAGGYLSVGKLTARVEKKATNLPSPSGRGGKALIPHSCFAVRTPTAVVTDLGTEFGVEVGEEGRTTSYVFQGVVEVQPVARDGKRGQAVRLTADESAVVEKDENSEGLTIRRAEADPAAFVRSEQIPKLVEELRLKAFRRWQACSQELRRDPSLLAYYDFQQMPGKPAVLANVAANGDRSLDGVVENATWTTGRMTGKHALLFNGPAECVTLSLPQKTNDLTLAAWVCINSIDSDPVALLASAGWGQLGQVHWLLRPGGRMACDVFGLEGRNQLHILSVPLLDPDGFRRWTHLAIVHDRAAECARFYINGRLMESVEVKDDDALPQVKQVPICIGPACIGFWKQGNWQPENENRNFTGRIDELAVFGRALTSNEIRRMFDLGDPNGSENATSPKANK